MRPHPRMGPQLAFLKEKFNATNCDATIVRLTVKATKYVEGSFQYRRNHYSTQHKTRMGSQKAFLKKKTQRREP